MNESDGSAQSEDRATDRRNFDVFVSYARSDLEKASRVVKALEKLGYKVWWDKHIGGGSQFANEIQKALEECWVVVALYSSVSVKSQWVSNESLYALDKRKLVPVLLEDIEIPIHVRSLNVVSLNLWRGSEGDDNFRKVCGAVEEIRHVNGVAITESDSNCKKKGSMGLVRYLVAGLALVAIGAVVSLYRNQQIAVPLNGLTMGVVLKDDWNVCEASTVYNTVSANLNTFLESKSDEIVQFKPDVLKTYTSYDRLAEDLAQGRLHFAGEMSPYQIFDLNQRSGAVPIVSPSYGGNDTYHAIFFASNQTEDATPTHWESVISQLEADSQAKVAVLDKTSTSGFWYPRYTLLNDLGHKRRFSDIAAEKNNYESVYSAVEHNHQGVVIGAMAEFKHCKRGKHREDFEACVGKFPVVGRTGAIPNGGFVISEELLHVLEEKRMLALLQRGWGASVKNALGEETREAIKANCHGAETESQSSVAKYLPSDWTPVTIEHYSSAFRVFQE